MVSKYAAYFSYCPFATLLMSYRRGTDVLAILLKSDPSFGCFKKNLGQNFSKIGRCIVLQEKLIMVGPPIGVPSMIQKFVSLVRMVFRFEEEPFLSLPVSRHQNLIFQLFQHLYSGIPSFQG